MRGLRLALMLCVLAVAADAWALATYIGSGGGNIVGTQSPCTSGKIPKTSAGLVWECSDDAGAGTGAPTASTYILQTADGSLPNAQALGALSTGLVKNTNTTGVLSIYAGTGPVTNQVLKSLNPSGVGSFEQVTEAELNFAVATQAELDAEAALRAAHEVDTTAVHGIADTATLVLKDGSVAMDELNLTDMDGTPVAGRQLRVIDGMIRAETTGGVEGRYISNASLQEITTAAIANAAVTQPKMSIATTAGDANSLTLHDLINGTPSTSDCIIWNGTNWIPSASCGGGGSGTQPTVALVATSAITLSGEQTIDGTLTSTSRVLVTAQADATTNGVYVSAAGAWARATDFDSAGEFVAAHTIYVYGGTAYGGSTWTFSTQGTVTEWTTNLTYTNDPKDLKTSTRNAASGVFGLESDGNASFDRVAGFAQHADLAAANSITVTRRQMGIQSGSGAGNVTLTSVPVFAAAALTRNGAEFQLIGTHATDTITINNDTDGSDALASDVRLCGNAGSVTIGLGKSYPWFRWNANLEGGMVEQIGCLGLTQISRVDRDVADATSTATAFRVKYDDSNYIRLYHSGTEGYLETVISGAVSPNSTQKIGTGGVWRVKDSADADKLMVTNDTGVTRVLDDLDVDGNANVDGDLTVVGAVHGLTSKMEFNLLDPTATESGKLQQEWPAAMTLLEIQCSTDAGTIEVNLAERARATPNSGGTNALAANLTCDNNGAVTTTFADSAHAADVPIALILANPLSGPTVVRVHIKAKRT